MKYPQNLRIGDTIGITAPSSGINKEIKQKRLDEAIKQLKEMGYKVIETESVRKNYKGRSNNAKQRAKELMELWENKDVKLIIFATGGDYLMEILEYLDLKKINQLEPKWMQGYSDISTLEFLFHTVLEIPSIQCDTIKSYAMKPLYKNLTDALKIASGKDVIQKSFDKCEKVNLNMEEEFANQEEKQKENINMGYELTEKNNWKCLAKNKKVEIQGRMLGGNLDVIKMFFATKYDNIKNFIEKYKDDGIIWHLECFETSSPELTRTLWQMKNSGYFNNIKGIIFGRPLFFRTDYDTTFEQAVIEAIGDLDIPIIINADIGHVAPQMAIVNGGIMKIKYENNKAQIEYNTKLNRN